MHFLVYQIMKDTLKDDPDLIVQQFKNRRELMVWALDNGVRLTYSNAKIIGPEGEERGTSDIRSEIARIDAVAEELVATEVDKRILGGNNGQ